jgi:hypothetical protein
MPREISRPPLVTPSVVISDQALPALDIMSHHADLLPTSIRPFGQHGPGADWRSTELTMEALRG